jgi:uncharacterized membrane protein
MIDIPFTALDYAAFVWFVGSWISYQRFTAWAAAKGRPSLMSIMGEYRREWWRGIVSRDLRIVDAAILTNLANSSAFFASTTLLILGGLIALLGTSDRVMAVVSELPFSAHTEEAMWEYKIFLLLAIFVYAFFKFTWSLRQHNFCSVLIGASPPPKSDPDELARFVARSARLASSASDTFNYGLRAYYFGMAALAWFLNSWVFMAVTTFVVAILYYREFHSGALKVLSRV